jgi:hypothetical protein
MANPTYRVDGLQATCDWSIARTLVEVAASFTSGCSNTNVHSLARSSLFADVKTASITGNGVTDMLRARTLKNTQRWTLKIPQRWHK